MDKKDGQAAADILIKQYRKTKKALNPGSIFEEYELICAEMESQVVCRSSKDIKKHKQAKKSHS